MCLCLILIEYAKEAKEDAHISIQYREVDTYMGWLRLVGSLKTKVSNAKEPYKRDNFLQKRPSIVRSLLIVATPYPHIVGTDDIYVFQNVLDV